MYVGFKMGFYLKSFIFNISLLELTSLILLIFNWDDDVIENFFEVWYKIFIFYIEGDFDTKQNWV